MEILRQLSQIMLLFTTCYSHKLESEIVLFKLKLLQHTNKIIMAEHIIGLAPELPPAIDQDILV
uniref:Auxin response factor n=1 Tax=Rhizophora mucronata TaxID=61149 RepID=A0A2P2MQ18_RHIMU